VFLTRFATKATIAHRREHLWADVSALNRIEKSPKIEWMIPWVVEEILGRDVITGARLRNTESGERLEVECDGIFVAIGPDPKTEAFKDVVETDEKGFIVVRPGEHNDIDTGCFCLWGCLRSRIQAGSRVCGTSVYDSNAGGCQGVGR